MADQAHNTAASPSGSPVPKASPFSLDLSGLLNRWQMPEDVVIITSAVVVGVGTGLGAIAFIWLLEQIRTLTIWTQAGLGQIAGTFVAMGLAGLIVGFLVDRYAREAKGHGVPEVMEAVAMRGGRIRSIVAAVKVLASSITIGSGGSAGREGPIVQVGSALGSTLGQWLRFSDERVRTLVACGAAAGIASTFNAPIAGSLFAMEVILDSFTVRYFGAVVISAVSASIVSRSILGNVPAFQVPAYPLYHVGEVPIYIVLGILSALVAVAFIRVLYFAEGRFDRWRAPLYVRTAIGMLLTAVIGLLLPGRGILGPGLAAIGQTIAMNIDVTLGFMATMLIGKLVATSFTLGAGNSGGVFAPSLYMGATLGGMVGLAAHALWPDIAPNPGAYAIVGMAATFSAAARAPITAVIIVFEMSNDYKLIIPLMMATVLATLLAEHLHKESIYTLKLKLKGITLQRGRDVDVLQGVTVGEVISRDFDSVNKDATLDELSDRFTQTHRHGFPILDEQDKLCGMVTITDLDRALADQLPSNTTALDIGVPRDGLLVAAPSESVGIALARMGTRGLGRLPVVAEDDPNLLLGLIRRADIIRAYDIALSRRADLQYRTKRMSLRNIDGTVFSEITLEAGDVAVGKRLAEISPGFPKNCILVSVRRQGRMLMPHGDTAFLPGDQVTVFVNTGDLDVIRGCLRGRDAET